MSNKMEIGDLVRFKHDDYKNNNLGIIIKIIKRPFDFKYNILWAKPEMFSTGWELKHGWSANAWYSKHDLEIVKKK